MSGRLMLSKMEGKWVGWGPYDLTTLPPLTELFKMRFRKKDYDPQIKGQILAILNIGTFRFQLGSGAYEMTPAELFEAGIVHDETGEPFGVKLKEEVLNEEHTWGVKETDEWLKTVTLLTPKGRKAVISQCRKFSKQYPKDSITIKLSDDDIGVIIDVWSPKVENVDTRALWYDDINGEENG